MLRIWLQCCLWACALTLYIADTMMWYTIVLAFTGGFKAMCKYGAALSARVRGETALLALEAKATRVLLGACPDKKVAWDTLWAYIVEDMYTGFLLSEKEKRVLLDKGPSVALAVNSAEARNLPVTSQTLHGPP